MTSTKEQPLAFAVMVGGDVYELETSAENAQQEAGRIGGRVVELIDRAVVAELIEAIKSERRLRQVGIVDERLPAASRRVDAALVRAGGAA